MAGRLECASPDVSELVISASGCGQERPCTFLERDTESEPSHGALSREEGDLRVGTWGCPCREEPQSVVSQLGTAPGLRHATQRLALVWAPEWSFGPAKELCPRGWWRSAE